MLTEQINQMISSHVAESIRVKQALLEDKGLMQQVYDACQVCIEAYQRNNKTLFAGNGGSAADAQHLAGEFVARFYFDRPGLASIALTTDTSVMTAIGNDYGYEHLFARQVEANGRTGDVFFGFSTSGNSKNILLALQTCKSMGITTIGLTGAKGGQMNELCDICIKVPSTDTPRIQESHGLIGHIICAVVEEALFGQSHRASL